MSSIYAQTELLETLFENQTQRQIGAILSGQHIDFEDLSPEAFNSLVSDPEQLATIAAKILEEGHAIKNPIKLDAMAIPVDENIIQELMSPKDGSYALIINQASNGHMTVERYSTEAGITPPTIDDEIDTIADKPYSITATNRIVMISFGSKDDINREVIENSLRDLSNMVENGEVIRGAQVQFSARGVPHIIEDVISDTYDTEQFQNAVDAFYETYLDSQNDHRSLNEILNWDDDDTSASIGRREEQLGWDHTTAAAMQLPQNFLTESFSEADANGYENTASRDFKDTPAYTA